MLAEAITRRRVERFFDAFERKDLDTMMTFFPAGCVLEFDPGLPMSGRWQGPGIRDLFAAVLAHNATIEITLRDVAVSHAWSPRGRMTGYVTWTVTEVGVDGDRVTTDVVTVSETDRWRVVHSCDHFADLPAMARHYAGFQRLVAA